MYEVPLSRVGKQEIGLHITRSWLERLDHATWDIIDPDETESWVSQDLLKTCGSFSNPSVSELEYCQIG